MMTCLPSCVSVLSSKKGLVYRSAYGQKPKKHLPTPPVPLVSMRVTAGRGGPEPGFYSLQPPVPNEATLFLNLALSLLAPHHPQFSVGKEQAGSAGSLEYVTALTSLGASLQMNSSKIL